jgi:hypothetical protein
MRLNTPIEGCKYFETCIWPSDYNRNLRLKAKIQYKLAQLVDQALCDESFDSVWDVPGSNAA